MSLHAGDAKYGLGVDEDGNPTFVGYSFGGAVDAPPPAMGTFIEVLGCSRAEYDASLATGGCARGPLVVTAIANEAYDPNNAPGIRPPAPFSKM